LCPDAVAALPLRSGRAGQRWPTALGLANLCFEGAKRIVVF